jgi:hypothetical protein
VSVQSVEGLASDGTNLYWGRSFVGAYTLSSVIERPIAGGTPTALTPAFQVYDVAIDGTYIYWVSDSGIMRTPIGGGSSVLMASATSHGIAAHTLLVDDNNIYWSTQSAIFKLTPK